jgi:hypothetical protein
MPFKQALKKKDLQDYRSAYRHLIQNPRKPGDLHPIKNQIARSLDLLKRQIDNSDKLDNCDQHAVIVFTHQLNLDTAHHQIADYLPDLHRLIVLAGDEVEQTRLNDISLGNQVRFIPLNQNGQWRNTLVEQIQSCF